jgi:hypothetical protein
MSTNVSHNSSSSIHRFPIHTNEISSSNIWQDILSCDAKFNLYRINSNSQLRTLYMRRRTQLMRESSSKFKDKQDVEDARRAYLNIRTQILGRKCGQLDQISLSSFKTNKKNQNKFDSISLNSDLNSTSNYSKRFYGILNTNSNIAHALNPYNNNNSSFMYSSRESLNTIPSTSSLKQQNRSLNNEASSSDLAIKHFNKVF